MLDKYQKHVDAKLNRQDHMIAYVGRQMVDVHGELMPEFEGKSDAGRFSASTTMTVDPLAVKLFAIRHLSDPLTGARTLTFVFSNEIQQLVHLVAKD
jgi:hypothetical protein